jgi:hypothetical protein
MTRCLEHRAVDVRTDAGRSHLPVPLFRASHSGLHRAPACIPLRHSVGLSNDQTGYTNFAFISTSVLAGFVGGVLVGDSQLAVVGLVLRVLFFLGTAAIAVLAVLTRPEVFPHIDDDSM